jgi:hypothetical protein
MNVRYSARQAKSEQADCRENRNAALLNRVLPVQQELMAQAQLAGVTLMCRSPRAASRTVSCLNSAV